MFLENGSLNVPLVAALLAFLAPTVATTVSTVLQARNARRAQLAAQKAADTTEEVKHELLEHRKVTGRRLDNLVGINDGRLLRAQKRIEELEEQIMLATGERPPPAPIDFELKALENRVTED